MDNIADAKPPFSERRKLLAVREDAQKVAGEIKALLASQNEAQLRSVLDEHHPTDLADAMLFLSEAQEQTVFKLLTPLEAAEVLDEVDATTRGHLIKVTSPGRGGLRAGRFVK